jgi:putative ABC transport system substrate-binding protein
MSKATRRKFLLASSALLAAPRVSLSQSIQQVRRIGILFPGFSTDQMGQSSRQIALESLRRAGYEEGRNLVIEWRFGDWKYGLLRRMADELVRLNVELIIAATNLAIFAAKAATKTIPIVMAGSFLPVESRLVESLANPGGNVTGAAWWDKPQTADKSIQLLKEAVPRATRVAVFVDSSVPLADQYTYFHGDEQLRNLAAVGLTLQRFELSPKNNLAAVLEQVARQSDALMVYLANPVVQTHRPEIIEFTIKRKLVSIGDSPFYVSEGGLLYYGPSFASIWERTASYVDRILRGAKPADLPVELAAKWELVMNAKTARAIGFKPPQAFMLRVDRVVE